MLYNHTWSVVFPQTDVPAVIISFYIATNFDKLFVPDFLVLPPPPSALQITLQHTLNIL